MRSDAARGPRRFRARAANTVAVRVLLLAATALSAAPVSAAEWVNPGIGDWFDRANWDLGSVPASDDALFFGNGGTAQVTGGDAAVGDLLVIGTEQGNGAVEVSGAGSSLTIGNHLYLGDYSLGTLNVSDGGEVSVGSITYVGANMGSTGIATVSGAGSVLSTTFLSVGHIGRGTIDVTNGGTLKSENSAIAGGPYGKVTVDGAGSSWSTGQLFVGNFGDGFLDITNGGTVTSSYSIIATYLSSSSSVLVDGVGSTWTIDDTLTVGNQGRGVLTVSNGGVVTSGESWIGNTDGAGTVTVDGAGSRWNIDGDLHIGMIRKSVLTISNGASVSADSIDLGGFAGTLNIGAASGEEAKAAGVLDAESVVMQSPDARLVFNHTNADYVFDAKISGVGGIELSGPGRTVLTGSSRDFAGKINLLDGELVVDGWLGGDMTSKARLSGTGIVRNVSVVGGGVIAPGHDDIGTLAMEGNLYMGPGSTYEVEITSGSSDLIQVMGIAYVEGADIAVKRGTGPVALGAGHIILSADEGFYGSFGDVISDYAFISPELKLGSDGFSDLVTLEFNRNGVAFADVAKTANQASAAAALDGLGTNNAAHNTILSLNEAEAQAMFNMLSGEGHATLKGVLMDNAGLVSDALLQRLDAARTLRRERLCGAAGAAGSERRQRDLGPVLWRPQGAWQRRQRGERRVLVGWVAAGGRSRCRRVAGRSCSAGRADRSVGRRSRY